MASPRKISKPCLAHRRPSFTLPDDVKATVPWNPNNVGWEKMSQVRPSTGAADTKESYQLQFGENMKGLWMSDEHVPEFQAKCLAFMRRVQKVSENLMICFARGLGFPDDFFIKFHDISRPNSQTTFRLLHYYATARDRRWEDLPPRRCTCRLGVSHSPFPTRRADWT